MLRVVWNPPRSHGSLISNVLLQIQVLDDDWERQADAQRFKDGNAPGGDDEPEPTRQTPVQGDDDDGGTRGQSRLEAMLNVRQGSEVTKTDQDLANEGIKPDEIREAMARMMNPKAVSVLAQLKPTPWRTVDMPMDVAMGRALHAAPQDDAEFARLPASASGVRLVRRRVYSEFIVPDLRPSTWYVFRIRFGNQRMWSGWSKSSEPCCVYPDWPDVIRRGPKLRAESPFSLYVLWRQPYGNGSVVSEYKLEHRRLRFRPMDPEPHPDDSDSPPEDGAPWDDEWRAEQTIDARFAQFLGTKAEQLSFQRSHAGTTEIPVIDVDLQWLEGCRQRFAAWQEPAAGPKTRPTCGAVVTGLRPGTRSMLRVSGANFLGYPPFSQSSYAMNTQGTWLPHCTLAPRLCVQACCAGVPWLHQACSRMCRRRAS
jgi:hypothetical protein